MKRNSTTLFLECPNTILPLPWSGLDNVISNIESAYQSPTSEVAIDSWQAFLASGNQLEVIADPVPVPPQPDWNGLLNAILGGVLFAIYSRLTTANFVDPATATNQQIANANNIAVASGKLDQSVQVTKVEGAVQASFQLLVTTSNYRFTSEEKTLWDATVTALNFSSAVFLP